MQDAINDKTVNLCARIGRITADELKKAVDTLLAELGTSGKNNMDGKTTLKHGKQPLKQLDRHNAGRSSIELTGPNLRLLKHEMDRKGVDFAIQKDGKGKYLLFFKANDADAMTQAFKSYSRKTVKQAERPSITKTLAAMKQKAVSLNADRDKVKNRDKGARAI